MSGHVSNRASRRGSPLAFEVHIEGKHSVIDPLCPSSGRQRTDAETQAPTRSEAVTLGRQTVPPKMPPPVKTFLELLEMPPLQHVERHEEPRSEPPAGRAVPALTGPPATGLTGSLRACTGKELHSAPSAMLALLLSEGFWRFPPHTSTFLLAPGTLRLTSTCYFLCKRTVSASPGSQNNSNLGYFSSSLKMHGNVSSKKLLQVRSLLTKSPLK